MSLKVITSDVIKQMTSLIASLKKDLNARTRECLTKIEGPLNKKKRAAN
jgi:hypothetical protein